MAHTRICRWLTDKYILLMLLVFPLFCGGSGYQQLTRSKFLFFAAATGIWLAGLAVFGLLALRGGARPKRPSALHCLAGAFLLWSCVSALASAHGKTVLLGAGRYDGLLSTLLYGAVFLGVSATGQARRRYFAALALSGSLCCAVAIGQLCGKNPLGLFPSDYTYYDGGVRYAGAFLGTIGNVDLLADFLCLSIPLFWADLVQKGDRLSVLLLAAAGLECFVLAASGVSSGALAAAVALALGCPVLLQSPRQVQKAMAGLLVLLLCALLGRTVSFTGGRMHLCWPLLVLLPLPGALLCFPRRLSTRPDRRIPQRLALLLCAAAAGGFLLLWFWPGGSGTVYELHRVLHGQVEDSFGSSRIRIWRDCLALVREHPLLGGGPGTVAQRLDIHFQRTVAETGATLRTVVDNAHNEYLTTLLDLGIPGLLLRLAMIAASLLCWLRLRHTASAACRRSLGCALVAVWGQACFGLGLCITAPIGWLLWGLFAVPATETSAHGAAAETVIKRPYLA